MQFSIVHFPLSVRANCPTNFQAELFDDGSFDYRYPDRTVSYTPVFPFDWDGDGLENSVDPEPLVAGADAHGTNVEWYNTVCSNVFMVVEGDDGIAFAPRHEGVNTNAYYFVDVVAERGPAPIYFTADGESNLGNPTIVARAGVTNHVPLLIGLEYAVTSSVPISVSTQSAQYAVLTSCSPTGYTVCWPINFNVLTANGGHTVTISLVPADPGGQFVWSADEDGDTTLSGVPQLNCPYSVDGGCITFGCGSQPCGCTGCSLSGVFRLEGACMKLPTVWCGCWGDAADDAPEPAPVSHADMASAPAVTCSFNVPQVLFEDAYTNAPEDIVEKQSTTTTLTVSAYGGANGAFLSLVDSNLGTSLEKIGGPSLPVSRVRIPANSDVTYNFVFKGKSPSVEENDVWVEARLTAINEMSPSPSVATMTSVQMTMRADTSFPENRARHVFGPLERTWFTVEPECLQGMVEIVGSVPNGGRIVRKRSPVLMTMPDDACLFTLVAKLKGLTGQGQLSLPFRVITPLPVVQFADGESFSAQDYDTLKMPHLDIPPPPNSNQVGVAWKIRARVLPSYVSFEHLYLQEGTADAVSIWGCFTNVPPSSLAHDTEAGGSEATYLPGTQILRGNIVDWDRVAWWSCPDDPPPYEAGGFTMPIPWRWYAEGRVGMHEWMTVPQITEVRLDGSVSITKYGATVTRTFNGEFSCVNTSSEH